MPIANPSGRLWTRRTTKTRTEAFTPALIARSTWRWRASSAPRTAIRNSTPVPSPAATEPADLVEPRQDQADDRGDPHRPGRDAEEQGLERRRALAEQEHRNRPSPVASAVPVAARSRISMEATVRPAVRGSEHQGGDDRQVDDDRE